MIFKIKNICFFFFIEDVFKIDMIDLAKASFTDLFRSRSRTSNHSSTLVRISTNKNHLVSVILAVILTL